MEEYKEKAKEIMVIGHKNPDTDSICSAICYADLKNKITGTDNYVPKRAGHLNEETHFVLNRFGVEAPEYIKDVRPQVMNIEIRHTEGIDREISVRNAWKLMDSLNVVTLPKTIDNDLVGTDVSFGFQSAVDIATNTIDCIHTTAASHSRVFIVELMGHKTGWLTLHAGIAGGSDVILIPEIPYDLDKVVEAINKRINDKKHFTILAVAEGIISKEEMLYSKKELKEVRKKEHYPSAAYRIGAGIMDRTGQEVRVTVPGHVQRGGSPCAYDRVLASRLGAKAAELIINKEYGYMVCVRNNQIDKIELNKVAGRLKTVDPQAGIITEAKAMGICFGD